VEEGSTLVGMATTTPSLASFKVICYGNTFMMYLTRGVRSDFGTH